MTPNFYWLGVWYYFLLAGGTYTMLVSAFLLFKQYRNKQTWFIAAFGLSYGFLVIIATLVYLIALKYQTHWWLGIWLIPATCMCYVYLFLCFALVYPKWPTWLSWQILALLAVPTLFFACLSWGPTRFWSDVVIANRFPVVTFTWQMIPYNLYCALYCLAGCLIIYLKYRHIRESGNILEIKRMRTILLASSICVSLSVTGVALQGLGIIPKNDLNDISCILFSLFLTWGIIRYRAFDVRTVIHRTILWVCGHFIVLLPLVFVAMLIPVQWLFGTDDHLFQLMWGMAVLVYYYQANRHVFPWFKRISLRRLYDLDNAIARFNYEITQIRHRNALYPLVANHLKYTLYSEDFALLLPEFNSQFFGHFHASGITLSLPKDRMDLFAAHPFWYRPMHKNIPVRDMPDDVDLAIAIGPQGERGMLLLTAKRNLSPYQLDEIQFLLATADRIASWLNEEAPISKEWQRMGELCHDIKNLSTGLPVFLTGFKSKTDLTDQDRQHLNMVSEHLKHLQSILHRYIQPPHNQNPSPYSDLSQLVHHAIHTQIASLNAKSLNVRTLIPDPLAAQRVPADLLIALINILENATRYAPEFSDILCKVVENRDTKSLAISIGNFGPVIPASVLSKLSTHWFSGSDSEKTTGLGLAIVHKIVHAHQGHLTIESNAISGTIFTLHVPASVMETVSC